jgi:hypothetical protein
VRQGSRYGGFAAYSTGGCDEAAYSTGGCG